VNTLAFWLLSASWLRLPYLLASAISTQIAIVWHFVLIEHLVYRRAQARSEPIDFCASGW
jgi:putative flippase GtrA